MAKNQKPIVKLVRDKLKEKIVEGEIKVKTPKSRRTVFAIAMGSETQLLKLAEKAPEEAAEFFKALRSGDIIKARKELGDLLDVIDGICNFPDFDQRHVAPLRRAKKAKNGGFDKWIIASFHPKTFAELYADKPKPKAKKAKKQKRQ